MKPHSPILILAFWLTAMVLTCFMLYSCEKAVILPVRDCPYQDRDTPVILPDTTSQI